MALLTRFATLNEYRAYIANNNVQLPNISYVDELENNRHIHITKERFKFGDVLLYHKVLGIKFGVNIDLYESRYKSNSDIEPQGLCVIPTGLLSDGYARFISIDGQTTARWNTNQMTNGNSGSFKDTGLTNFTTIRTWSRDILLANYLTDTGGSASNARTPIERQTGTATTTGFNTQSNINTNLYYYVEYTDGNPSTTANYTQPLYLQDWTLNPAHFSNLRITDYLADQDGFANTQYLMSICESTIPTYDENATVSTITWGYFNAAAYCYNYSKSGIGSGKWYLPSIAELALGLTRYNTINSLLARITGGALLVSNYYWSSTEYNAINAANFRTNYGYISSNYKYSSSYVRPFFRM